VTDGIYNNRAQLANLISVAIQEMVSQGRSLGITWSLRLGTVAQAQGIVDIGGQVVTVVLDGDTVPMTVDNMTGQPVATNDRVVTVQIPPAGNFIIGSPTIGRPVGCTARGNAQSIPNNVGTNFTWDTVSFDSGGFAGTVPFTSFTVPTGLGGVYAVSARMGMTGAGGTRNFLTIDGSPTFPGIDARAFFGSGETACNTTAVLFLDSGQQVFVQMLQTSGSAQTTTAKEFNIYRIG
jgi:hypothetical protein